MKEILETRVGLRFIKLTKSEPQCKRAIKKLGFQIENIQVLEKKGRIVDRIYIFRSKDGTLHGANSGNVIGAFLKMGFVISKENQIKELYELYNKNTKRTRGRIWSGIRSRIKPIPKS